MSDLNLVSSCESNGLETECAKSGWRFFANNSRTEGLRQNPRAGGERAGRYLQILVMREAKWGSPLPSVKDCQKSVGKEGGV